ncbi:MAG: HAD-IB family hydrolase [Acidimicrobiales bacterium]
MPAAAFFDLDRTLLLKASGTVFAKHLNTHGLGSSARIPGASLVVSLYDLFGETRLNMEVAQRLVRTAQGWPVDSVETAAKTSAEELADQIPAYALQILDEHRAAGRLLVLATTSPTVLVGPLAEQLGFDAVLATEWSHDGTSFDGTSVGPFVWGPKKRDAVVEWAAENNVPLVDSYAYSDSYYDCPMLDVVGHPVAVNPDARLAAVAALKAWPIRHFDAPPGVLKFLGRELQDWIRPFSRPELLPLADYTFDGLENVPADGPAILAFNHRSYFDTAAMNLLIAKIGRPCRFLAKKELFDAPLIGQIAALAGGIEVDRGTGSNEPLESAVKALSAGEMVAIAPQGTIPRGRAFFDTVLTGRPGAARLAAQSGAPVVPVGLWGTERVWPRNERLPRVDVARRPKVAVRVGEPLAVDGADDVADTAAIMAAIVDQLPDEARLPRDPSPEELARTYPPGHSGDDG